MKKMFTNNKFTSPLLLTRLFLFIGLLTYAANAFATIRYVKEIGTGDGSNWDNASSNLQAIIDASASGDEVWVAKGTYQPGTSFSMIEGVKIYGGFEGNEASLILRDLTKTANASTLQGNNNHPVVITLFGEQIANAELDGFIITGGNGGVRCLNSSITVRNCSITGNKGFEYGGVFSAGSNSSLVLVNCSVTNNSCSLVDSEGTGAGGLKNNIFSAITLINCTISGNTATGNGTGGIANEAGQSLKLRNCILYGNSGGIVSNNPPDIQFSLVQGLTNTDNGNISGDIDPLFVDAANKNYRLQLCSPVINKGSNTIYESGQDRDLTGITTDMDGEARFYGSGTVDMGAYEFHQFTTEPVAGVTYVKAGATGTGTSWDCPTGDLQAAIDASESGQEVWVAGGTYQNRNNPGYFSMKEGVKIYGGFKENETSLSQRDLTNTSNTSTLLAYGTSVVGNFGNGLTPAAVLDGFTITGGNYIGGIRNRSVSPTFRNCIITGNSTGFGTGGGINNEGSSPVLINCVISNNSSPNGLGGGIFNFNNSSPVLINCTISGNKALTGGGGGILNVENSSPVLINCTISGNTAGTGGGIYNTGRSTLILRNTIIYGNSSGIHNADSSPDIQYSLVQGLTNTNNGNISGATDPLFVDPANGDYRLQSCSPVINKGSNSYYATGQTPLLTAITTDLDGEARFYGSGTVDMGAYEFHQFTIAPVTGVTYVKVDATGTGTSWDCPTGDLQAAINAASSGEEVWVAGGTYQNRNSPEYFSMKEGVKIYGGFEGYETTLSQRDLTNTSNTSTLQRNNTWVVRNHGNGLTPAAVLDGFTITGGRGSGVANSAASPTFRNCIITGNSNLVSSSGGGMYNEDSSPALINCVISNNTSTGLGGGIFNWFSSPVLINCTISGNTALTGGGSIFNAEQSTPILRNTIIFGNSSGIEGSDGPNSDIKHSLVQSLTNTDNGNISGDTDPLFADAANGDYRLQPCSPVMNNGSNAFYSSAEFPYLANVSTDLLGEPRFYANGIVDMGAYEYGGDPSVPTLAGDNAEFTQTISGSTLIGVNGSACTIIARLSPNGAEALAGDVTAKVWVETTQPVQFVKRHYQLTPTTKPDIATAKVTLYFTQQEFTDFNAANSVKLPINPTDSENYKTNLRIEKRAGSSDDDSGLPGSYDGAVVTINPLDPTVNGSITWNTQASRWEVSFDVTGFSGFFAKTMEAALPLNLISFTGTKENGVNVLNWKTTSEINTSNFEVQSSRDAKTFAKIGTVPANGSGNHQYSYQDGKLYSGTSYYRLKMVDRDGTFAYSKIISIMNDAVSKAIVHPNPAVETITLTISPTLLQSTATLYDVTGRPLKTITLTTNKQQVDVKSLSSGVYLLKFADGSTERFVKE